MSDMLISNKLMDELNAQIGREFGASLEYVAIASYFEANTLPQLAGFFYRQSDEERDHAMRFVRFVLDSGGRIEIPSIPASSSSFASAAKAVGAALEWERDVTRHINALMALAVEERNYIAQQYLQWFVGEQLEEVATMSALRDTVRRAGEERLLDVESYVARMPPPADGGPGGQIA